MTKTAVVTGGAGFIGSNLSRRLCDNGWNATIIDNLSSGYQHLVAPLLDDGVKFMFADYGSDAAAKEIKALQPDALFHIGAIPRVGYSVAEPIKTHQNNVLQTIKMLKACEGNVGRVVFSSSSSVIGDTNVFPTPVDLKRVPKSPYALQKAEVEDYMRLWATLYGLDTVCLRYFNVFGPNQYGDSPYSTVVSAWCNNFKNNIPLRLDGSGEQSRDFCYVDNVVDANLLAAQSPKSFKGDAFNIAGGQCLSVNDVLAKFRERFDITESDIIHYPERQGDVFKTEADITRTTSILGYNPRVKFDEGLEKTFAWWKL